MSNSRRNSTRAAAPARSAELERLRQAIDAVDRAILEKLNERGRIVLQVGELKRASGEPVYDAARERDLVARLVAANPGPFPGAGIGPVFREIISATRSLEQRLRVAFLGPEGTYSHLAVREQFGEQAAIVGVPSIRDIFAAVERGTADFGVVPVENSTEGTVTASVDALVVSQVAICGEILLPVSHFLLSRTGRREDIGRVASHPQPLAQCRQWLEQNLPSVERVETPSTAAAAQLAAGDPAVAAIASSIAGETYGLEVVEPCIEDRRDNTTRFLVIGATSPPPSGNDLTSAVFSVRKDEAGALHRLLEPFAEHGVNLTAIQSRPMKDRVWEYLFFVDLEGHRDEERVARALADASRRAYWSKVLGSFPRAAAPVRKRAGTS
ncbi:MAG: prephenate dehydratase [Deltaproteobacteria bacterium]|nr:MAG: prephenate dehydratase [Deltaproteobacteria bacterium]